MPRILSVSYDSTLLRTRQMVLESRGYEVVSAHGFTDAVEKCKSGKYDLLIIGHSIPHNDKRAIIRELNAHCPAPVLALMRATEGHLAEATASVEPNPEQVLAAVESLLSPAKGAPASD
jgi:DNA-binding response OmpR family regulator